MEINTITIKEEYMPEDFEAWSGGKDVLNAILAHEEAYTMLALLTDIINDQEMDGVVTDTQVNDFLWFNAVDFIEEYLDIALFD